MALDFMQEAVVSSYGVRYQYGFRLTQRQVVEEWLYAYVTHRRQVWFERDASSPDVWYFGKSFTGRNKVIADLTRPSALFLSTAAANNHRLAIRVEYFFRSCLYSSWQQDKEGRAALTRRLIEDERARIAIVSLLRFADLGVNEVRLRQEALADEQVSEAIGTTGERVELGHSTGQGDVSVHLPFYAESLGTQTWFALIGPVFAALGTGSVMLIDELDASLHPRLTAEVLRLFSDPRDNPLQARLIFTSRDTTLLGSMLDGRGLTRDQVWFTGKKPDGGTVLYPLTDFSPRKTENLEGGYLQGRYGAVPYLNLEALREGGTASVRAAARGGAGFPQWRRSGCLP